MRGVGPRRAGLQSSWARLRVRGAGACPLLPAPGPCRPGLEPSRAGPPRAGSSCAAAVRPHVAASRLAERPAGVRTLAPWALWRAPRAGGGLVLPGPVRASSVLSLMAQGGPLIPLSPPAAQVHLTPRLGPTLPAVASPPAAPPSMPAGCLPWCRPASCAASRRPAPPGVGPVPSAPMVAPPRPPLPAPSPCRSPGGDATLDAAAAFPRAAAPRVAGGPAGALALASWALWRAPWVGRGPALPGLVGASPVLPLMP